MESVIGALRVLLFIEVGRKMRMALCVCHSVFHAASHVCCEAAFFASDIKCSLLIDIFSWRDSHAQHENHLYHRPGQRG